MTFIRVLLALFGFQCIFSSVISKIVADSKWVYASDFTSYELANLSLKEEHELLLKSLSQKSSYLLKEVFAVEMIANSIGNDFFELIPDEKSSIETKAIIKAAFHCMTQIRLQEHFEKLVGSAAYEAPKFFNETGSLGTAYTKLWSKFDDDVKNETCYTTFKDKKKQQAGVVPKSEFTGQYMYVYNTGRLPKITYQYGIPKSAEDLQKSLLELANDPQWKKLSAFLQTLETDFGGKVFCLAVTEFAKLPVKGEAVQKIFEESINETIPLIKDISPDPNQPITDAVILIYVATNRDFLKAVREKLRSKIMENPNLKEDFEKILTRVCESEVMRGDVNLNCTIPTQLPLTKY